MLEVKKINLSYGESHILFDMSVDVKIGKVTTILGRNGVGKTSLLKSIIGLEQIDSGRINLNKMDITKSSSPERANSGIAYVPQGREIFSLLTVEENLQTGFSVLKRNDRKISKYIYDLFPVLSDMKSRRGGDLSGGHLINPLLFYFSYHLKLEINHKYILKSFYHFFLKLKNLFVDSLLLLIKKKFLFLEEHMQFLN